MVASEINIIKSHSLIAVHLRNIRATIIRVIPRCSDLEPKQRSINKYKELLVLLQCDGAN